MTSPPDVGDSAPDASLVDGRGVPLELARQWADRTAVLVFLRYFGCPFCQAQVVGLRRDRERFDATGCRVVMIGQGDPRDCGEFCDPARIPRGSTTCCARACPSPYARNAARAGSRSTVNVALPWLRLQLHTETRQRGMRGGSFMQLAGTFVVDRTGEVRMAHRSRHIADGPSNQAILDVLWRITTGPTPGSRTVSPVRRPIDEAPNARGSRPPSHPSGV